MDAVADILLEFIHALTHHVIASRVVASRAAAAQSHHHVLYGARVKAHDDDAAVCAYVERAFESLRQGVSSGDVHTVGVLVREAEERVESFEFSLDVAAAPEPSEENKRAVRSALSTLATWFVLAVDGLAVVGNGPSRSFEIIARAASARCPETWRAEADDNDDSVGVKNGHVVKTKRVQNGVFTIDVRCTIARRA
jgi:hypothetical protein